MNRYYFLRAKKIYGTQGDEFFFLNPLQWISFAQRKYIATMCAVRHLKTNKIENFVFNR